MDINSDLPDEIIDIILEKLPLLDMVRTSILSKSWRLRWRCFPSLIMDKEFYNSTGIRQRPQKIQQDIIKGIISQHTGSIDDFSLFFNYSSDPPIGYRFYWDIIDYVTRNDSVERLSFEGPGLKQGSLGGSFYSLKNLKELKIIELYFFPPPGFEGFPNLTLLSLISPITSCYYVSLFVSRCPKLEKIILDEFNQYEILDFKAPQLSHLYIDSYFKDIFVSNPQKLESLYIYRGSHYGDDYMKITEIYFNFLKSSTQLKHITFTGSLCKMLGRCNVIYKLPIFGLVTSLELKHVVLDKTNQLLCVLHLLACCPNLRYLNLRMQGDSEDEYLAQNESMIDKYINTDFKHLVKVELYEIVCKQVEMKIIERLLRYSPALEMMKIRVYKSDFKKSRKIRLDESDFEKSREVITKFLQASAKVKLELW